MWNYERPAVVDQGTEFGHWEIDTVVGKKKGIEAFVLTIVEKITHEFIAPKFSRRYSEFVTQDFNKLESIYGNHIAMTKHCGLRI